MDRIERIEPQRREIPALQRAERRTRGERQGRGDGGSRREPAEEPLPAEQQTGDGPEDENGGHIDVRV